MANENGWGDGSVNNAIGWGQGANNAISWGKSHLDSWSGATDIDGGNAPINTVAPALSGTAQEGQTLTCSTGTWSGSPTYAYQWKRNGNNIGSATNSTYTLVTADVGQSIKCTVTATNFSGSANADSNTVVPISAFTGLLDTYPNAAAAYSLRKLRSAYTGNAIRVRRSSDNAEQDFGFVNNVLDTSALLTFCGAGNGFVTTWYDQSGNSRNSTQTTAINQPQIVSSGSVISNNGTNAISFDGSNDSLNPIDFALPTSSIFSVVRTLAPNQYNSIYSRGTTSSSNYSRDALLYINRTANRLEFQRSNNVNFPTSVISINLNNTILATGIYTGSALNVYANGTIGTSQSTTISGTTSNASSSIGALKENAITSFYLTGFINEIIVYDSDQSTNRTGIESNINTFYTIY